MNNYELNSMLKSKFINILKKYNDEVSWQEGDYTGSHVVYGDVLTPYLKTCIQQNNQKELKKIFIFIEEILDINDKYSNEVITFSVLESILELYKKYDAIRINMGEKAKKIIQELIESSY